MESIKAMRIVATCTCSTEEYQLMAKIKDVAFYIRQDNNRCGCDMYVIDNFMKNVNIKLSIRRAGRLNNDSLDETTIIAIINDVQVSRKLFAIVDDYGDENLLTICYPEER